MAWNKALQLKQQLNVFTYFQESPVPSVPTASEERTTILSQIEEV